MIFAMMRETFGGRIELPGLRVRTSRRDASPPPLLACREHPLGTFLRSTRAHLANPGW